MKIVLIGFMGSGKSSVGRILANRLGYSFVEMDSEISKLSEGLEISEIFSVYGQEHFRNLELQVAQQLSTMQEVIISSGGGVVDYPNTLKALKSGNAVLVHLDCPINVIQSRLENAEEKDKRPLFKDTAQFLDLFANREQKYRDAATISISVGSESIKEVAEKIVSLINTQVT